MNYAESLDYLNATASRGSRLGLERVQELVKRLGNPQNSVPIVHIAGTNGKGSVGAMLSSVLTKAGYRTGHFSSPAITSPTDYFRINTQEISGECFAALMTAIAVEEPYMSELPTQFEILAAAAYLLFAQEKCDIAVIECCMGGDLDCTNIVDVPLLSIITNVALDHTSILGDTVAEIATHKAGIIKAGCPVLVGQTDMTAFSVLQDKAASLCAPLYNARILTGKALKMDLSGTDYEYDGQTYRLSLLGKHQLSNADIMLRAVWLLRERGLVLPEDAVRRGLAQVQWHGRFEVLHRSPLVLYDGAHNPDGIRMASQTLDVYFGRQQAVFVVGVMADKAYAGYAEALGSHIAYVCTVKPDNPRALGAVALARVFTQAEIPAKAYETVEDGVQAAVRMAEQQGIPVIGIGSLYLYREFCEALKKIL